MAFAFSLFPCLLKVLMYLPQQERDVNVFSWFSKFLLRGNRGGRTQSRNTMSCSVSVYFVPPIPREVTQERNQSCCWKSWKVHLRLLALPARHFENSGPTESLMLRSFYHSFPRHLTISFTEMKIGSDVHRLLESRPTVSPWYTRPWPWKCERRHILVVH